jgi:hypothetical protein
MFIEIEMISIIHVGYIVGSGISLQSDGSIDSLRPVFVGQFHEHVVSVSSSHVASLMDGE